MDAITLIHEILYCETQARLLEESLPLVIVGQGSWMQQQIVASIRDYRDKAITYRGALARLSASC